MGNGYRLLVVEDDRNLCESLADVLRLCGYEVDTAQDGEEALERLRAAPRPDAVLLDVVLPRMGSQALLVRLRGGAAPSPAVVLMSGMVPGHDGIPADVLVKPFEIQELLARVERACGAPPAPALSP
ncbi:MAG TPA: response regulator [Anaeromyxobacteraceae bacterium]|nr:response regulator [Anaeromyxobacteraceae bacterium]